MNNSSNRSQNQMDWIINRVGGAADTEKLRRAAANGNAAEILASVSAEDRKKIEQALSDKSVLQKILSDPNTEKLIKGLNQK